MSMRGERAPPSIVLAARKIVAGWWDGQLVVTVAERLDIDGEGEIER